MPVARRRRKDAVITAPPAAGPSTFSELSLDFRILSVIKSLGWDVPTPIQRAVIPLALAGRDVIAQARTGSGKTAAFALPILQALISARNAPPTPSSVRALVVCPTRDLSAQTTRTLLKFTSAIPTLPAPVDVSAHRAAPSATLLAAGCLVGTPAAILRSITTAPAVVDDIAIFVVDEADAVLASVSGEAAELRRLLGAAKKTAPPQALLLSATLPRDAASLRRVLQLTSPVEVRLEDEPVTVTETTIPCRSADRALCSFALFHSGVIATSRITKRQRADATGAKGAEGAEKVPRGTLRVHRRALMFVNNVDNGFRLKLLLEMAKVPVGIIHERLPVNSRVAVVSQFNAGVFDVLVAVDPHPDAPGVKIAEAGAKGSKGLDAAAAVDTARPEEDVEGGADDQRAAASSGAYGIHRGVDFVGVDVVVSVDPPHSVGSYVHRVGRTGRGVERGDAILLSDPDSAAERMLLRHIREHKVQTAGEARPFEHPQSEDGSVHAAMERVRYRIEDALRRLTRPTLRAAEIADLDAQLVNSERLAAHFDANPGDLNELRKASAVTKARLDGVGHALATITQPAGPAAAAQRARMARLMALTERLEAPLLKGMTEPLQSKLPSRASKSAKADRNGDGAKDSADKPWSWSDSEDDADGGKKSKDRKREGGDGDEGDDNASDGAAPSKRQRSESADSDRESDSAAAAPPAKRVPRIDRYAASTADTRAARAARKARDDDLTGAGVDADASAARAQPRAAGESSRGDSRADVRSRADRSAAGSVRGSKLGSMRGSARGVRGGVRGAAALEAADQL